jgi:spermidine synthase
MLRTSSPAGWAGLFFFLSGATALIYEVVWLRLLGNVFGVTTFAIAAVLATYMAGLGLGSFAVGRRADRWSRPLRAYGVMEIGIGAYAALTLPLLAVIEAAYVGIARSLHPGIGLYAFIRLLLSSLVIFVPTFFMGATLPVLARATIRDGAGIGSGTAFLYGLNTAGAVLGTFLAGFLLLPALGIRMTLASAVVLNVAVGASAWILSKRTQGDAVARTVPRQEADAGDSAAGRLLLAGLFLTGFLSMLLEIGWTRVLASVLDNSTYAFTLMLGTFLLGLALGSGVYRKILGRRAASPFDWGGLALAIGLLSLLTLPLFERVDLFTVRLYAFSMGNMAQLQTLRFLTCAVLMLGPTLAFGALFPVSAALYTGDLRRIGRGLGALYLSNTAGTIVGSIGAGFFLIPWIGIHKTILIASLAAAVAGIAVLAPLSRRRPAAGAVALAAAALLAWGFLSSRGGWDPRMLTSGLHIAPERLVSKSTPEILRSTYDANAVFYREGANSIVSILDNRSGRALRINGKADASDSGDMSTQLLLGHLPHLVHPGAPGRSLVIGFGSGVTVAAAAAHGSERVDCVEIEAAVLEGKHLFDHVNRKIYDHPSVRLIVNDGRNHLLVEEEPYDVVISEPSNPWMAGVASLFSVEFYELVASRLAPQGVLCQWIHIYSMAPGDFRMVVASIRKVFAHVSIWTPLSGDVLILATREPLVLDLEKIQRRIDASGVIGDDMARMGISGAIGLVTLFELGAGDVDRFVEGSDLNTDDRLRLEFNAPKSLYVDTVRLTQGLLASHRSVPLPAMKPITPPMERNAALWARLGETYLARDRPSDAESGFRRALQIAPDDPRALIGMGTLLIRNGRLEESLRVLEAALGIDPAGAEAHVQRGAAFYALGRFEEAAADCERAVALGAPGETPRVRLGDSYEKLEDWEGAARAFGDAFGLAPRNAATALAYSRSLIRSGRGAEAVGLLERFHEAQPAVDEVFEELGRLYEERGDRTAAVRLLERRVRENPYRVDSLLALARLYRLEGRSLEPILEMGRRIDPFFEERIEIASAGAAGTPG